MEEPLRRKHSPAMKHAHTPADFPQALPSHLKRERYRRFRRKIFFSDMHEGEEHSSNSSLELDPCHLSSQSVSQSWASGQHRSCAPPQTCPFVRCCHQACPDYTTPISIPNLKVGLLLNFFSWVQRAILKWVGRGANLAPRTSANSARVCESHSGDTGETLNSFSILQVVISPAALYKLQYYLLESRLSRTAGVVERKFFAHWPLPDLTAVKKESNSFAEFMGRQRRRRAVG